MQKVIRRTILAEKQVARRTKRRNSEEGRRWRKTNREQTTFINKERSSALKQARRNRREDWELGPIAPRRDVGDWKDKYGTVSTQFMKGPILEKKDRIKAREAVGGHYMNIVTGDRVVLLQGKDKGQIGKITRVDRERGEYTVEGLNMIDVAVPKWMQELDDADNRPIRTVEKPVPFSAVRLVYPLEDKETGITRDVIVKELVNSRIWFDKHTGKRSWSRIIPGLDIVVPWPKKLPKEHKDHPNDTLRSDVEIRTFMPTLTTPPMPGSVIDELRNKYSVFRTRHDPEYIAAKIAEDEAEKARKRSTKEMQLTPLREYHRAQRKLNRAKGKTQILTPEMKERIGQIIARKRQLVIGVEAA